MGSGGLEKRRTRASPAFHCTTVSILSVLYFPFNTEAWKNVDKSSLFSEAAPLDCTYCESQSTTCGNSLTSSLQFAVWKRKHHHRQPLLVCRQIRRLLYVRSGSVEDTSVASQRWWVKTSTVIQFIRTINMATMLAINQCRLLLFDSHVHSPPET